MRHFVIASEPGLFLGWPANNGAWSWDGGREILVGCVAGAYDESAGFHAIQPPYTHRLLRSVDGGESWRVETPSPFVTLDARLAPLHAALDFEHPGFGVRVVGDGYHGCADPRGSFLYTYDRGRTWRGPHPFNGLETEPRLAGLRLTPRTDVLLRGAHEGLFLLSARPNDAFTDRVFCARTRDGGQTFQFLAWIVPPADPYRAVMPATVDCGGGLLVSVVRRRAVPEDRCWIDAYASSDAGLSWSFLSRVGDSGGANGNPPALLGLPDGGLCCVYGRRDTRQMVARASRDGGLSWGDERVMRDDFFGARPDFGYPRLVLRADGRLMAFYYWATRELPNQHIAASVWESI